MTRRIIIRGTSLVVQWLGLCASTAGGTGLIPGWGTRTPNASWSGKKNLYIYIFSYSDLIKLSPNLNKKIIQYELWIFTVYVYHFCSVQFSRSVMFNFLRPHGLQHARLPCSSPTPRACQTHVHRVGDAIHPSHPLLSPSPLPHAISVTEFVNSKRQNRNLRWCLAV